jgi:hypothetical protein
VIYVLAGWILAAFAAAPVAGKRVRRRIAKKLAILQAERRLAAAETETAPRPPTTGWLPVPGRGGAARPGIGSPPSGVR